MALFISYEVVIGFSTVREAFVKAITPMSRARYSVCLLEFHNLATLQYEYRLVTVQQAGQS